MNVATVGADTFKLDFKNLCEIVPNKYFLVQTVLTLNSNEKKIYQIQCTLKNMKCIGVNLGLGKKEITPDSLVPQVFDATNINITENTATFIYNNVTFTADKKDNKVKMTINVSTDGSNEKKSFEEYWVGSCK